MMKLSKHFMKCTKKRGGCNVEKNRAKKHQPRASGLSKERQDCDNSD